MMEERAGNIKVHSGGSGGVRASQEGGIPPALLVAPPSAVLHHWSGRLDLNQRPPEPHSKKVKLCLLPEPFEIKR